MIEIILQNPFLVISVTIGAMLIFTRRYFNGGVCYSKELLDGKTVIITGANTGIGKETAIDLARRNARVIIACRNVERGEKAERDIRNLSKNEKVHFKLLDLASFASIRRFCSEVLAEEPRLDILINNAGLFRKSNPTDWKTEDGFEMHFGVNHLGHFLLTNLLLDRIKEAPAGRIIVVSSLGHKMAKEINFDDINSTRSCDGGIAYCQSKLANNLFTIALHRRLAGTNVTVNCLHPGVVYTELLRYMNIRLWLKILLVPVALLAMKSPWKGAQTNIYCAVDKELDGVSGLYFVDCKKKQPAPQALDEFAAEKLWAFSVKLTGLEQQPVESL